ncbi:hypothetical protein Tco_0189379 [Tanacetum coccineum]
MGSLNGLSRLRIIASEKRGGTGGRTGRGGGRTRGQSGDQCNSKIDGQGGQSSKVNDSVPDFSTIIAEQLRNLLPTIVSQVGDQGRGQGNGRNQNGDAINDNIRGDVRNVIENNDRRRCTYKEFLACNPKEYDGKGDAVVYTRWIKKMESVQDKSGYGDNQKVKYTAGSFVGKALTWWNSQILTLGREVAVEEKLENELWNHAMRRGRGHAAWCTGRWEFHGSEEGSFIVIPFKVSALNVDFDFKIDLIAFGPETGSAPASFSNEGSGVLQTKDSPAES